MWDFSVSRSVGLLSKTLPFILLRTGVYLGCSLLAVLGFVGGPLLGVALLPESMWKIGVWGGLFVGAGLCGSAIYFLREYFLYLAKAGHIAVLVELMEKRELPDGRGQLEHAKTIVADRFVEANAFFAVDKVISGVLSVVHRTLIAMGSIIPGSSGVVSFAGKILKTSLTYADEVILALSFKTRSDDPWKTSRDGMVLYAQNYKTILKLSLIHI